MMKMKRKCNILTATIASLPRLATIAALTVLIPQLTACSSDGGDTPDAPVPQPVPTGGELITYSVGCNGNINNTGTRGGDGLVEFYDDLTSREIDVTAVFENGSNYFSDNRLLCSGGTWNTETSNYWPLDNLSFYAHLPYNDENIQGGSSYQRFNYQSPQHNNGQHDFMYAVNKNVTRNTDVQLNFKHALAAVTFEGKVNSLGLVVVVSGIDVCNVMTTGQFNFPSESTKEPTANDDGIVIDDSPMGQWSNIGTNGILSAGVEEITLNTDMLRITSDVGTLMMIPQTLTKWNRGTDENPNPISDTGSYLVIHCSLLSNGLYFAGSEGRADGLVYVPFEGTFEAGKHYTISLTFGTGFTADGLTNRIKVDLESTITDWNREEIKFDKKIL